MTILIINGPNLNLLGAREPEIYGSATLEDLTRGLETAFPEVEFEFYQSNHEGDLIDRLQEAAKTEADGIVFNPAGYSHTSVALRDTIGAIGIPVVEVHISNIHARERFRHRSMTGAASIGQIAGLGVAGYHLAVRYLLDWYPAP